jgi:hypothetical protein
MESNPNLGNTVLVSGALTFIFGVGILSLYKVTRMTLWETNDLHKLTHLKESVRPTACVSGGWAGWDNATLPEPTPSHTSGSKTRRLPDFRCTHC